MLRDRDDCRDHILSLKAAIQEVVGLEFGDTNSQNIKTLTKAVRVAEEAWENAQASIVETEKSPQFTVVKNLTLLERWTNGNRYFRLTREGRSLLVNDRDARERLIGPLPPLQIPRLPSMKADAA